VIVILIVAVILVLVYTTFLGDDDDESSVSLNCYNPQHEIHPTGITQFVFVLENKAQSDSRNFIKLEIVDQPEGWDVNLDQLNSMLSKDDREIRILTVVGPEGVDFGTFEIKVRATSLTFEDSSSAMVRVKAKPQPSDRIVQSKDHIYANYVGYLGDGSIFDTSVQSVAYSNVPKTDDFSPRGEGQYTQFDFTVDNEPRDVIVGFDEGVMGMHVGETWIIKVPPSKGYTDSSHALYDKILYFELTLEKFD